MALGGNPMSTAVDLLEWQDPQDGEAPYPHLYHLGLARVALVTSDMDADTATLKEAGVEFISEPVSLAGPTGDPVRFVCFKDPDGTVLELVQAGQAAG